MKYPFTHIVVTCPSKEKEACYEEQLAELGGKHFECQIYTCSDPDGVRIGSGGGSLNALDRLRQNIGIVAMQTAKILIVHSGGDSRRAPLHSVCGKAWASINSVGVDNDAMTTPILLLLKEIGCFFERVRLQEGSFCVASSDVLLSLNITSMSDSINFPRDSISVVAVPEAPIIAKNHGVLVHDSSSLPSTESNRIIVARAVQYLQKPSIEEMGQLGAINAHGKSLIDTGLVVATGKAYGAFLSLLDEPVVSHCTERMLKACPSAVALRLELYSDMLLVLALKGGRATLAEYSSRLGLTTCLSKTEDTNQHRAALLILWRTLSETPLFVVECSDGAFCHLGTSQELLDLVCFDDKHVCSDVNKDQIGEKQLEGFLIEKCRLFGSKYSLVSQCGSVCGGKSKSKRESERRGQVSINSVEIQKNISAQEPSLVEHSTLLSHKARSKNSIISHLNTLLGGLPTPPSLLSLQPEMMIQMVPLSSPQAHSHAEAGRIDGQARDVWAVSLIGITDPVKLPYDSPCGKATICGAQWSSFFAVTEWEPHDVWDTVEDRAEGLWAARIFCEAQLRLVTGEQPHYDQSGPSLAKGIRTDACFLVTSQSSSSIASVVALTWMQYMRACELESHDSSCSGDSSSIPALNSDIMSAKLLSLCENEKSLGEPERGYLLDQINAGLMDYRNTPRQQRVSLRDLLSRGDAFRMYQWRNLLNCIMQPLLAPLMRVARIGLNSAHRLLDHRDEQQLGSGKSLRDQSENRCDQLVRALPVILSRYCFHLHIASTPSSSKLDRELVLAMWIARLCLGPVEEEYDRRYDDALGNLAYHYKALSLKTGDDDGGGETYKAIVPSFLRFWHEVTHCLGPRISDTSLAVLLFLRKQAGVDQESGNNACGGGLKRLGLVCSLLSAVTSCVQPRSHPRLFLLCGWLLSSQGNIEDQKNTEKASAEMKDVPSPVLDLLSYATAAFSMAHEKGFDKGYLVCKAIAAEIKKAYDQFFNGNMVESHFLVSLAWQMERVGQLLIQSHVQHSMRLLTGTAQGVRHESTMGQRGNNSISDTSARYGNGAWVVAHAPARVDLAGGWSDTPPICYENPFGGCVFNVAVKVDGRRPIASCCRFLDRPVLILHTLHVERVSGADAEGCVVGPTEEIKELEGFFRGGAAPAEDIHGLLKACCIVMGLVPPWLSSLADKREGDLDLKTYLSRHCGGRGVEIACVSDLPAGSGLGGSSILAMSVVAALHRLLSTLEDRYGVIKRDGSPLQPCESEARNQGQLSSSQLVYLTSLVEQLLTTGGGWQDQCGALPGGFKLSVSSGELPLSVTSSEVLPVDKEAFLHHLHSRCFLVYTGVTRLARNTLINALRGFSYTPLEPINTELSSRGEMGESGTVVRLITSAKAAAAELSSADSSSSCNDRVDQLAHRISEYWRLKVEMAEGSEPQHISDLLDFLRPHCAGLALCGAGAGGFAILIMKRECGSADKYQFLKELLSDYDSNMTVHRLEVDCVGLHTSFVSSERASLSANTLLAETLTM